MKHNPRSRRDPLVDCKEQDVQCEVLGWDRDHIPRVPLPDNIAVGSSPPRSSLVATLIVGGWVDFHYLVQSTDLDGLRFIVGPGISAGFIIITHLAFTQYNTSVGSLQYCTVQPISTGAQTCQTYTQPYFTHLHNPKPAHAWAALQTSIPTNIF
ncbi:MAG: hypothetical protein GY696_13080 [Gammaproteobacteria bacterium]|nr:hypothetical protein [Gammaproteobacteria bacterium]